jgi:hypothetical protein
MEARDLLSTFYVRNTDDSGTGSLRAAILAANAHPGADAIAFEIPASTDPLLDLPVDGFDPGTQTWTITPKTPLPVITDQVTLDAYTQAHSPVPFRYPDVIAQTLNLTGSPTGGSFTLSIDLPSTSGGPTTTYTTRPIPYDANTAVVLAALEDVLGTGNFSASGGPALPNNTMTISFTGAFAGVRAPLMTATNNLTGGTSPQVQIARIANGLPTPITSASNGVAAKQGNDARIRVVLDGTSTPDSPGLVLDASHSQVRGLAIEGFGVGISIPNRHNVGNLIQGNFLGPYLAYPVDLASGTPRSAPDNVTLLGSGNAAQGVLVAGTNTTIGGSDPQAANVIAGNGAQGVSILAGSEGNQVLGDQIGIVGPSINGRFFLLPNGAEGVLIASSSNVVGGPAPGAGNLISANAGDGVHLVGPSATRNNVDANYIGIGPGGGFVYGAEGTGNGGDGVRVEDAPGNRIGSAVGNVISANAGAGVRLLGSSDATFVQKNLIGLTSDGSAPRGNAGEGVAVFSASNVVSGNTISANLRGVLLAGAGAVGNRVSDNRIGTDPAGLADLGNAIEGVRIDNAPSNTVTGDGNGSQVISGNDVGVLIVNPGASGNLVAGNFLGTDASGTLDRANAREGVRIQQAPHNTVGGTTTAARNLISANHWGVILNGASAAGNTIEGNLIGTDITGNAPLGNGNEVDGVLIQAGASGNLVGGPAPEAGNTLAFNVRNGVRVEDSGSVRNAILTNRIFSNGALGIDLAAAGDPPSGITPDDPGDGDAGPNALQNAPRVTAVATAIAYTHINGTLQSAPNTTYTIQLFANGAPDPSGRGEGERFLGQATATTDGRGFATFAADVAATIPAGQLVTATATDPSGNTSEFSPGVAESLGTVQFRLTAYQVEEGAGRATITVTRTGGSGGSFTVDYATSDGTAGAGSDYSATSGTLTFNVGEDVQSFTIPIRDDAVAEADEAVRLTLSNPAGAAKLGAPSTAILTIHDDDQPGAFTFDASHYVVDEAAGQAIITVVRDHGGGTVTVHYSTGDGTARAGVDYGPVAGTLTFGPGVTSRTFAVPIILNPAHANGLALGLTLSDPTGGAALGTPAAATLTIADDTADRLGPVVTSASASFGRPGLAAVRVAFSEPLDPTGARALVNYGFSLRTAGRDGRLGTPDDGLIGLASATYDPATATVTLRTASALRRGQAVLLTINAATAVPGVGVSDLAGNLLDGDRDSRPGGAFAAVVLADAPPAAGPRRAASARTSRSQQGSA